MIGILVMSAKFDASGLLKMKVFWNEDYDVKTFVYDATNKVLFYFLFLAVFSFTNIHYS